MNPTIISSLISAGMSLLVCIVTNHASNEKTRALLEYRLGQLESKVEKHNSIVERTFILEEKVRVANHRIDDLERKGD